MLLVERPRAGRGVARDRVVDLAEGVAHVGLAFGLDVAFVLDTDLVEEQAVVGEQLARDVDERRLALAEVRDGECGNSREAVGIDERGIPDDWRAPVMAEQDGLAAAERIGHRLVVGDDGFHVVGFDRMRLRGAAIAAHVDGGSCIARRRQQAASGGARNTSSPASHGPSGQAGRSPPPQRERCSRRTGRSGTHGPYRVLLGDRMYRLRYAGKAGPCLGRPHLNQAGAWAKA